MCLGFKNHTAEGHAGRRLCLGFPDLGLLVFMIQTPVTGQKLGGGGIELGGQRQISIHI